MKGTLGNGGGKGTLCNGGGKGTLGNGGGKGTLGNGGEKGTLGNGGEKGTLGNGGEKGTLGNGGGKGTLGNGKEIFACQWCACLNMAMYLCASEVYWVCTCTCAYNTVPHVCTHTAQCHMYVHI